jgi:hypothetical protein
MIRFSLLYNFGDVFYQLLDVIANDLTEYDALSYKMYEFHETTF